MLLIYAVVFRHRTATEDELGHAVSWALMKRKASYDYAGAYRAGVQPGTRLHAAHKTAVRAMMPGGYVLGKLAIEALESVLPEQEQNHEHTFFCSELILRAFQIAGIPVVDKPAEDVGPNRATRTKDLVLMGRLQLPKED